MNLQDIQDWGPDVAKKAIEQAKVNLKYPLNVNGVPDPNLLINLGVYNPETFLRPSHIDYLKNGKPLNNFTNGIRVSSNQVPNWVWITMGVTLIGYAGYIYYRK